MVDRRAAALDGAGSMAPLLLGVVPFGLVAGAAAVQAGFSPVLAVAMSAIVFAGAAQLAVVELVGSGAAPAVVVATGVVVNLRYLMYSAGLAPYFRSFGRAWRLLLGYLLTDQAFALSVTRYESEDPIAGQGDDSDGEPDHPIARRWYYLGGAVVLWVAWVTTTAVGVLVGARIPRAWSLEFAVPLTFLALLVPAIEGRATAAAAVVAGAVAVLGVELPLNLGLMTGAVTGLVAGGIVDLRWGSGPGEAEDSAVKPADAADGTPSGGDGDDVVDGDGDDRDDSDPASDGGDRP